MLILKAWAKLLGICKATERGHNIKEQVDRKKIIRDEIEDNKGSRKWG